MIVHLDPTRSDQDQPTVTVTGDTITINGTAYVFSPLAEGSTLPSDAIDSEWIIGDVTRTDGEIVLSLLLPHGARAPEATRFPQPITVTTDGPVELPIYDEPLPEPEEEPLP